MTKEQKEKIRIKITDLIEKTLKEIEDLRDLTKPIAPENAIGRISRMDAINNKSVNEATLRKAEVKLSNLKLALAKVDDKDFGVCVKCKGEIPIGRIMLLPQSRMCVRCASR